MVRKYNNVSIDELSGEWYTSEGKLYKLKEVVMTDTKPKAKMTRAEAIKMLERHVLVSQPTAIIDFYIEAGMLEIVEEEKKPLIVGYTFEKIEQELFDAGYDVIKR